MDIGAVISRSFSIAWRSRFLWVLAILGAGEFGAASVRAPDDGASFGAGSIGGGVPGVPSEATGGLAWAQEHMALLAGLAALIVLVIVVAILVGTLISSYLTAAMVRATAEKDAGRPWSVGETLRGGVAGMGRLFLLRLVAVAVQGLWLGVILLPVLWPILTVQRQVSDGAGLLGAFLGAGALTLTLLLLSVVPWLAFGVVVNPAVRAIVLEGRGPLSAAGRAWGMMRHRFGRVVIAWLASVGLGVGAGLVISLGLALAGLPFTLVGYAAQQVAGWLATIVSLMGWSATTALSLLACAIAGTFFSVFWTLVYRRLELDPARAPAPPPAPGYAPRYGPGVRQW